jgi:hypothetical protein
VVYETGFEDPPFADNSILLGQDGWGGVTTFSPFAAVVAAGPNAGGNQTLRVDGANLEHQDFLIGTSGGHYDAIGSYRRPVNYETFGTQVIRVAADVYLSGPQTPDGTNFFSAALSTRTLLGDLTTTAGTGEIAISSDGHVYVHCGCQNAPFFHASAPVTLNAWHNLAVRVDFWDRRYSFEVDGASLGTYAFVQPPVPELPILDYLNIFARCSLLAYAAPDTAEMQKNQYTAYYDSFSIVATLAGDFNEDNRVDGADYVVWRKGLGTTYTRFAFDAWRLNFGATLGSGVAASMSDAVPEPDALLLIAILAVSPRCVRRRESVTNVAPAIKSHVHSSRGNPGLLANGRKTTRRH